MSREAADAEQEQPTIVCLCGSSRFKEAFAQAAAAEALAGRIVLSLGIFSQADGIELSTEQVELQHLLHRRRIDMADEVLVINPSSYGGESTREEIEYAITCSGFYVGESTREEIEYAIACGKRVRWLNE